MITPRSALLDIMAIDDLVERRKAVIKWFDTWLVILGAEVVFSKDALLLPRDPKELVAQEHELLVRALFERLVKEGARERVLQVVDEGKDINGNFLSRVELRLLRFPHDP